MNMSEMNSTPFFNYALRPDIEPEALSSDHEKADALKKLVRKQKSVFCFVGDSEKLVIIVGCKNRTSNDDIDLFTSKDDDGWTVNQLQPIIE